MVEYTYPGRRIPYDVDGTRVFLLNSERYSIDKNTLVQLPPMAIAGMNADIAGGLFVNGRSWTYYPEPLPVVVPGVWGEATYNLARNSVILFFAEPKWLRGWYANLAIAWQSTPVNINDRPSYSFTYPEFELEVSHDTTNGQDGTWYSMDYRDANQFFPSNNGQLQTRTTWYDNTGAWVGEWPIQNNGTSTRDKFTRANPDLDEFQDGRLTGRGWTPLYGGNTRNVRAVRLSTSASGPNSSLGFALIQLHLYGEPDVNAGLQRLAVVDVETEEETTEHPHWGFVDYREGASISIGVKNMDPTQTAQGVNVTIGESFPSGLPWTVYSSDRDNPDPVVAYYIDPIEPFLEVSLDEVTWAKTVELGDLDPGQTVEVFARLLPPIGWTLPPPLYIDYLTGFQDPVPIYVSTGVIGLRGARFIIETDGWV